MQPSIAQPNAATLPEELVASIVAALVPERAAEPVRTTHSDVHSNDVTSVRLADGRTLMIKRGRYEWSAARFETSRRASVLMRSIGIEAPAPLALPELDDRPLEAYWRIELPTLEELWPSLDGPARRGALRSLGELVGRIHRVSLPGFGPLASVYREGEPLARMLEAELAQRLLPAAHGEWPQGVNSIERLLEAIPALEPRMRGRRPALVHHDLHLGNVLCAGEGTPVRCVGLLDLETAAASVPESDLAMMQVLHGPLFGRHLAEPWFREVRRGYGDVPDPWVLRFFRIFHLLNLGFYSALVGHAWHAEEVARETRREEEALAAPAPVPAAAASG